MTEFEKAMIILKLAELEYQHALLCASDPRATPIATAKKIADRSARALKQQCPYVAQLLREVTE